MGGCCSGDKLEEHKPRKANLTAKQEKELADVNIFEGEQEKDDLTHLTHTDERKEHGGFDKQKDSIHALDEYSP